MASSIRSVKQVHEWRENTKLVMSDHCNPYVLISGTGRSGSNRLLDILDASLTTVCRSEVNEISGSDFAKIHCELFCENLGVEQIAGLRRALSKAKSRRSARDRFNRPEKIFLNAAGRAALAPMSKTRIRRALRSLGLLRSDLEWQFPALCLKKSLLANATLVLKLNSCPAWASALAREDKNCRVVHNIRDPLGYLQSWYNRFIQNHVGSTSFEENFGDVPRLLARFGRSHAERLEVPTEENLVEVELWRWRYVNECLHELVAFPARYLLVTYSEFEGDPVDAGERLFNFAGLPFGDAEKMRIASMKNVLFKEAHSTKLDAQLCERLIDKVLEDSPLKSIPFNGRGPLS